MHNSLFIRVLSAALILGASWAFAEDQIRFGTPVKADAGESVANVLPLSSDKPPQELADGAELIVISGYKPYNANNTGNRVKVAVNRPGARILLVLTSYEKVVWEVADIPKTKIAGIVTSGYEKPTIVTTAKTVAYLQKLPYACETENSNFKALLVKLNQLFGITKVDAFRGKHAIPQLVTVSELDHPGVPLTLEGPASQKPNLNFTFNLVSTDFKNNKWSLTGPFQPTEKSYFGNGKIALSKSGKILFKLVKNGIEITKIADNGHTVVSIPSNFPRFSWAMDIALDRKREIVSVVSLGGEGFLYRFDVKTKKWIDFRSLNNVDIFSLSYDPAADRYVGWMNGGKLIFISSNGEPLFTRKLIDRLPGFGRLYDRGNERAPRVTIAPNGNNIALIYIEDDVVCNIWLYRLASQSAMLTYKKKPLKTVPLKRCKKPLRGGEVKSSTSYQTYSKTSGQSHRYFHVQVLETSDSGLSDIILNAYEKRFFLKAWFQTFARLICTAGNNLNLQTIGTIRKLNGTNGKSYI